jgi:hypothetical protein
MVYGSYDFTTNNDPADGEPTTPLKATALIYALITGPCPRIILFDIEKLDINGDRAFYRFSVAKAQDSLGLYTRSVVTHEGSDRGDGIWKCSKRDGNDCIHVLAARKYMRREDADETGENTNEGAVADGGFNICECAFSFQFERSI